MLIRTGMPTTELCYICLPMLLIHMKQFILFSLIAFSIDVAAQGDREFIYEQFNRISGSWEGFMEFTDESDNFTKYSLPAKCQSTFNGTKWEYAVQYDHGRGDMTGGKGECTVNEEGTKMNYDGVIWDITSVVEHGDTTDIVIETKGKEKRRPTDLRRTITVNSVGFFIIEEVRTEDWGPNYIVRNRHIFRRPARSKD
jgi:hypothetical protein